MGYIKKPKPYLQLDPDADFGKRLKWLMERDGMKCSELAERLGTFQTQISRYRSGVYKPSEKRLRQISEIFGVPVSWMLGEGVTWNATNNNIRVHHKRNWRYFRSFNVPDGYIRERFEGDRGIIEQKMQVSMNEEWNLIQVARGADGRSVEISCFLRDEQLELYDFRRIMRLVDAAAEEFETLIELRKAG